VHAGERAHESPLKSRGFAVRRKQETTLKSSFLAEYLRLFVYVKLVEENARTKTIVKAVLRCDVAAKGCLAGGLNFNFQPSRFSFQSSRRRV
jgi:hypothetical protein